MEDYNYFNQSKEREVNIKGWVRGRKRGKIGDLGGFRCGQKKNGIFYGRSMRDLFQKIITILGITNQKYQQKPQSPLSICLSIKYLNIKKIHFSKIHLIYYYIRMGSAFLTQPNKTKQLTKHQHGKLRVVTCQMQGWRKHMEDAVVFHRISKDIFLFAVFDGHGGVQVSKYCARHLPETVQKNSAFQRGDYEKALEQVFQELDKMMTSENGEKILQEITVEHGMQPFDNQNSKVSDSVGCTANVALLVGKKLYVANAGDSRAALSRLGSVIELSYDHKPQNPLELQRIVSSGSKVENGRINNHLNLSRSLGDHHYKKNSEAQYHRQTITGHPDIKTVQLCKDDDFIIMGCDGIWQRYQKNPQGLIDLIRGQRMKGKSPQVVLQEMLDSFLGKDPNTESLGCDNMSVILIELNKNAFA